MTQTDCRFVFGTGLSSEKTRDGLLPLVQKALSAGIYAFDTAPSYQTEAVLGEVLGEILSAENIPRERLWVQDKVDAWQMQESRGAVEKHVCDSLQKMRLDYFDCVLIHWPVPEYRDATLRALFSMKEDGLVRNVGICNVRLRQLEQLEAAGLLPDAVQIERNPLRTCIQENAFCRERALIQQSYSPLCKFSDGIKNSPVLRELAQKYGKSIGQIVMRWHIDTGAVPIFTTKKASRIEEYVNISEFKLEKEELERINSMNQNYKMYLESVQCPGF